MSSSSITTTSQSSNLPVTTAWSPGGKSRRELPFTIARFTLITVALIFALFPAVWMVSASLNPIGSMSTQSLIPTNVRSLDDLLRNYRVLFNDAQKPFWRWMFNSIVISGVTTVLVVSITAISAYAFSRFRFRGRRSLLLTLFLVQVFPNLLAMVALFLMLDVLGEYIPLFGLSTYGGLILIYLGGGMATNIWLMKGFFDSIPREIDESALVDGATHWQSFRYLIFPLVRPVLAVVGVLAFIGTFNDFILARIILREVDSWTLIRGLFSFVDGGRFTTEWGAFAAGSLIAAVPIVIVYISLQRFIVGGLTQGAVKG